MFSAFLGPKAIDFLKLVLCCVVCNTLWSLCLLISNSCLLALPNAFHLVFDVCVGGCVQGDGLTMGGLVVVRKGNGGVEYTFAEKSFGEHAAESEVGKR